MTSPTIQQVHEAVEVAIRGLRATTGSRAIDNSLGGSLFTGRLLAERHVQALRADQQELLIHPETVVTPMARDLLKQRRILVRIVSAADAFARGVEGEWGFHLESSARHLDAFRRALLSTQNRWTEIEGDIQDAAEWVSQALYRGLVAFTEESSVACWRSNQVPGVRAAAPSDPEAVGRAVTALGVNLLVLETRYQTIPALLHSCKVFRRTGAPAPPAWLDSMEGPVSGPVPYADWRSDRSVDLLQTSPESENFQVLDRGTDVSYGNRRGLGVARRTTRRLR